ncbi:hypothetical protein ACJZ2D_008117 [Fusarium nematophilum]
MDSTQTPGLYLSDYDWNRPLLSAEAVNRSAVEVWGEKLDGTPLELFQHIPDGSPRLYYQARELEAICSPRALHDLRRGVMQTPHEPIAWLDDRSQTGETREAGGWLTHASLYRALRTKRLQDTNADSNDSPDADRRLLYIPNPDSRSLWPVILTAPCLQAYVLSDFLWKHITAAWSIGVSFSDDGRCFSLEFHLPFYVWSESETVLCDRRVRSDKSPLRKSTRLSFLTTPGAATEADGNKVDCLHEAQWSCVVSGYNNTVWNGYGLADTYFYGADDPFDRSSVRYYQARLEDEEISHDPINGLDADFPIQNPREYFLIALRMKANHIKEEWIHTITRLERKMECDIEDRHVLLSHEISSLGGADDRSKSLQELYMWTKQVSRLLTNLTEKLNNTNTAWESFKARDVRYFQHINDADRRPGQMLHSIDTTFTELRALQVRLGNQTNKHEDFRKFLELYLQVENNRTIVLQQFNINLVNNFKRQIYADRLC